MPSSVPWHSSFRSSERYLTEPLSAAFSQPTICAAKHPRKLEAHAGKLQSKGRAAYVVGERAGAVGHGAAAGEVGTRGGQALGVVQRLRRKEVRQRLHRATKRCRLKSS